nr:PREDICTED: alpha-1,3-mannosyl-glycoprotein 4-beta-N-acetylglucosaminyltransferase B [Apteryx mantelli mantelli]
MACAWGRFADALPSLSALGDGSDRMPKPSWGPFPWRHRASLWEQKLQVQVINSSTLSSSSLDSNSQRLAPAVGVSRSLASGAGERYRILLLKLMPAAESPLLSDVVDIYQREFLALRDRLHAAEQESLKRSKELNLVLEEIKRAISEKQALRDINRTWSSLSDETKLKLWNITNKNVLHLPTIFHHLPHLLSKENSLQPAVHVGQGRTGVSVVMGIPSVKREVHSYLTDTLNSLISELTQQEKEDSVIVVLIAETDAQYTTGVAENIKNFCIFLAVAPVYIPGGLSGFRSAAVASPEPVQAGACDGAINNKGRSVGCLGRSESSWFLSFSTSAMLLPPPFISAVLGVALDRGTSVRVACFKARAGTPPPPGRCRFPANRRRSPAFLANWLWRAEAGQGPTQGSGKNSRVSPAAASRFLLLAFGALSVLQRLNQRGETPSASPRALSRFLLKPPSACRSHAGIPGAAGALTALLCRRWRTKQNLDYCFLMMYAQSKGIYYVQLEDDIVAKPNYLSTMKNFALQQPSEEWMILEFSQLGFIGKMFKSLDLSLIVEFILMFYKDKPIDWLLDHILWVKVCNPEKDAKHCDRQKANLRIRFKPSLFQHVGTHSSLAGKIQKLKDKDFGKQALRKEHVNPPAEVSTSLKTYQHFTLEKAYLREDFFWAFTPTAGDFIRFRFFKPLRIERFFFRSGNIEHPEDKLFNTTVEVLPFDSLQSDKEALQEGRGTAFKYRRTSDGYIQIGSFSKGVAEGEVDPSFGPLEAIRLAIQTDSPVWIILSEIFIKKAE